MSGPVLVTGAAGFVGRHLLDLLAADGTPLVGWHRANAGRVLPSTAGVRWMEVNLLDRAAVRAAIADVRPSAVFHLAGFANVAQSWTQTREAFEGNVLSTHHLFDALRAETLKPRVLVTLTSAVYRHQNRALTEEDVIEPLNPYASSKLAQEMVAMAAYAEDGIPTLLARAFNHTGPGQDLGYVVPDISKQIALIEIGKKAPDLSMGNLDAERDLSDVRDVVRAYAAMMRHGKPGVPYNVCAGKAISVRWLVETLAAGAKTPVRVVQDPAKMRPNDIPLVLGSHARLTADTGWTPAIGFDRTIADTLDYWRARIAREGS